MNTSYSNMLEKAKDMHSITERLKQQMRQWWLEPSEN